MDKRAAGEDAFKKAQRLWLASSILQQSLRAGSPSARSWEEQLKPLDREVSDVANAAGTDDAFILAVLSSIPKEALSRGVFPEEALKDRFVQVADSARKVAFIDEKGGSLLRYGFAYIMNMLVLRKHEIVPNEELKERPVDVESLSPFEVIDRARACMDKGDLLQAVQYLNLLNGAAGEVAKDWLKETILTLETKQAADAMLGYATALGTHGHPG
ncbi:unnamed protein product [Darwinula stevensoni]|uniref:MICOS complex subunit MIC60 n=1 Tax=Darwinula stevensoni TaxID=69355 RepID=A0A7R9FTN6_9CRUS|nr:unnamed protein product [Darwinula stevensoni]CAG0906603.1 unnamed protein product [Darwinula stevensoni]